jgi:hypothetical protein
LYSAIVRSSAGASRPSVTASSSTVSAVTGGTSVNTTSENPSMPSVVWSPTKNAVCSWLRQIS